MGRLIFSLVPMSELAQLTRLCHGLGATEVQAESMARQLMKRADQLVVERGQTREAAMAYLLNLLGQGSQGEVPREFPPTAQPGPPSE
jgi:hypothetical protein